MKGSPAGPSWLRPQGWEPDDLTANRAGRLSDRQAERIKRRMRRLLRTTAIWTLPAAVAALVFAIVATVRNHEPASFIIFGIVAVAITPSLGLAIVGTRLVRGDVRRGVVRSITGTCDLHYVTTATGVFTSRIGSMKLRSAGPNADRTWIETNRFVYRASTGSPPVCAYYLPRTRLLVAAEPVTPSTTGG